MMRRRRRRTHLLAIAVAVSASGCALLGPSSIRNARSAYNDAIVVTNAQQLLTMIVRRRYGEPSGLLAVSSVTANLHIQTSAGAEFGIGPDNNYKGNLTPLSTGVQFEENPTISYTPVQGERYLRQVLSPIPLDLTVLLLDGLRSSAVAFALLVEAINGIPNPAVAPDPESADPRFARIAEVLADLARRDCSAWSQKGDDPRSFELAVWGASEACRGDALELHQLLEFPLPADGTKVATIPVRLGIGKPAEPAIELRTHSLWELFGIAAASVEVPEEHLQAGIAERMPAPTAARQGIRIRGSKHRPEQAMIAVKVHGWWYSIDGGDAPSKLVFRVLEALMSVRMAEAVENKGTPVLTVPVSR